MANIMQTHLNKAQEAEEQIYAYDMKLKGYSLREIAAQSEQHVGRKLGKDTIAKRINDAIDIKLQPKVEEYRAIELERLENLITKLQPAVDNGDVQAINTYIKASESRRKLLGIDAPIRQDIAVINVDTTNTELGKLIAQRENANNNLRNELTNGNN